VLSGASVFGGVSGCGVDAGVPHEGTSPSQVIGGSGPAEASVQDAQTGPDAARDVSVAVEAGVDAAGDARSADADARTSIAAGDAGQDAPRNDAGHAVPDAQRSDAGDAAQAVDAGAPDATTGDAHVDAALDASADARSVDAADGAPPPVDAAVTTPALVYVGRFDVRDPLGPQMGWPGTQVVAQFEGTAVQVQLSQTDGYSGGPSWFNVVVDGVELAPFSLAGASVVVPLASGLAPGPHSVTIEKRTEANLGTVRFEGFTYAGGAGLLAPLPRPHHRIEFLSDSTIDGYGVLGDLATTCVTGDPAQYNDSRSSLAFLTATASGAELVLSAYSGKGLTVDEDPADTEVFPEIYPRALPDSSASPWPFVVDIPDAVVISLGGVDFNGLSAAPSGFQAAYDALVATLRARYPGAAIWLTVWSQVLNVPVPTRAAMTATLQAIVAARAAAGDANLFLYVFPEAAQADQTGCEGHANLAHEKAMAGLMTAEIQARLGW